MSASSTTTPPASSGTDPAFEYIDDGALKPARIWSRLIGIGAAGGALFGTLFFVPFAGLVFGGLFGALFAELDKTAVAAS